MYKDKYDLKQTFYKHSFVTRIIYIILLRANNKSSNSVINKDPILFTYQKKTLQKIKFQALPSFFICKVHYFQMFKIL